MSRSGRVTSSAFDFSAKKQEELHEVHESRLAASAAKGRADATRRHSLGVIAVPIAVITANTVATDTTLISHRGT